MIAFAALLAASAASCAHRDDKKKSAMTERDEAPSAAEPAKTTETACANALRNLVIDGDLAASPLPSGCRQPEVDAVLGKPAAIGNSPVVGSSLDWTEHAPADGPRAIRVWYDDQKQVLIVSIAGPRLPQSADELLGRLGEPERIVATISSSIAANDRRVNMDYSYRDYIFAKRGLTLSVGEPLEDTMPPGRDIGYAYLYQPTSVDDYLGRLGGNEPRVRKFPRRK